jgi:stage V sporulation protein R
MADWSWTVSDLEEWDERTYAKALEFGLTPYPVDFRVLDWDQLVGFMSYGMTFHYGHWSYGKDYDISMTAKRYEEQGLPYEMVVNTNPSVAVLWRDNSLVLQILVMAHVYGHSDFFANNTLFQKMTRADRIEEVCQTHAREISEMNRDPSIPSDRVEELLTIGHSLMFHRSRNPDYKRETREQIQERVVRQFRERHQPGEWDHLKPASELKIPMPDFNQVPLEPDEDLLRFLAEYAPLEGWERRILEIVASDSDRLIPNICTKVINEGWATYWHDRIVRSLDMLPSGFEIEYARTMAGVVRPQEVGINPYWLGLALWRDIYRRYETPDRNDPDEADLPGGEGDKMLFAIRELNSDSSFISGYLSDRLISGLKMFTLMYQGDHLDEEVYKITDVPDRQGFERIRRKVVASVGLNTIPVIRVHNANYYGDRTLHLEHVHDGRDLKLFKPDASLKIVRGMDKVPLSGIEKMLQQIGRIWRNPIRLTTRYDNTDLVVICDRNGNVDVKSA